jgi:hypothetical protein
MQASDYGMGHAINELLAIFDGQWANGLLPHVRYVPGQSSYRPDAPDWGIPEGLPGPTRVATSGITQPPIMARCAEIVFHRLAQPALFLTDFLTIEEGLERFHHFLLTERTPLDDGLVVCLHPWETGTDNSPAFEPLLQHTRAYLEAHATPIDTFGRADTQHVRAEHRPTAKDYVVYYGLIALFKQHGYDQRRIAAASPFMLQDVLFNSALVDSLDAVAQLQERLAPLVGGAEATRLYGRAAANRARRDRLAESIYGRTRTGCSMRVTPGMVALFRSPRSRR